ncbi:hypothetical protein NPIL_149581 [Nephila pilipes]|uniref:Uncharacterized protein n=1 Tax=Nephila pilipes TaxID=299642 RepID=A0A8X6NAE1_NEPPI|nr:hypothetical protein NPIL_149581 [Nephila pilipes]
MPEDTLNAWQRVRVINRSQREFESSEQKGKNESRHRMETDGLLHFCSMKLNLKREYLQLLSTLLNIRLLSLGMLTKHFGFKNRGVFSKTPSASILIATSEQNSTACIVFFVLEIVHLVIALKLERCRGKVKGSSK